MSEQGLTGYQIQGYAQHLKLEEKSEATLEKYLRDIRAFAAWANGQKISKELTAEWKNHLVEQHYAPTSINAMLSALNSLLEFLGLNDCRVKFLKVQRRLFRDADRELTKDDYQRLLNTAYQLGRDRLGLLVETIGATGILGQRSKICHSGSHSSGQGGDIPQGQDPHHPVAGKAPPQATEIRAETKDRLWRDLSHQKRKRAEPPSDLGRKLKGLCKHACVEPSKVFPLTATPVATVFYRVCRDIVKLADLLGHSSIETTRIYLVTSGSEHQRALDRLGLVS